MLAPRSKLWSTPPEAVKAGMGLLQLTPEDTVIDIGCGNGWTLVEGARLSPEGTQFVGYEIVADRAEEARKMIAEEGLADRITIHTGNVLDHKFGDEAIKAFAGKKFFLFLTTHGLLKLLPFFQAAAASGGGNVEVVSAMYPIKGVKHVASEKVDVGDFRWRLFHYRFDGTGQQGVLDAAAAAAAGGGHGGGGGAGGGGGDGSSGGVAPAPAESQAPVQAQADAGAAAAAASSAAPVTESKAAAEEDPGR